jgi:HK97 family phage prohead protease
MMFKAPKYAERSVSFETRDSGDDGFTLEGYAAVFNQATRIDSHEGRFDEVIDRGAFNKTLSERTPVLQFDHGRDPATGSVPIGSIEDIRSDDHGLFVRARLHDNARVEPIRQAIASGAVDGMSFRFQVIRDDFDESREVPMRTLREVSLLECGPVVFPAYAGASVGVRSILATLPEDERASLIEEIRQAILLDVTDVDAAVLGTSTEESDAVRSDTSEYAKKEKREALLRSFTLER